MILQSFLRFSTFVFSILVSDKALYTCRCLYGEQCWPNENEFAKLTSQLSRPVIHPLPPASACYPPSAPSGNCSDITANYTNGKWRSDQPGAMYHSNYETFISRDGTLSACYLDTTLGVPCRQGSIPPVGVDARSESDVQAAVNFAKQHNLKLVVKTTGHDFLGRSAARGSFLIWTHYMKQTVYIPTFVPEGAPVTAENTFNAVTFGAGVQWGEAFGFVEKHGRLVVGGAVVSVGAAGGWVMGGGHSACSPSFGLGVDNVLQFTVVLADGSLVTTNSYQYPDLFWALRGGGGGTYGVVTSATYKTYPTLSITSAVLTAKFDSPDIAQDVITEFIKFHPNFSDAGWSAYVDLSNSSFLASLVAPDAAWADASLAFFSFVQYVEEATGGQAQLDITPFASFYEFFLTTTAKSDRSTGTQVEMASRLVPRSLAENDPAKVAKILLSLNLSVDVHMASVGGGAVSRVDPDSTGLNPSWRNALSEVTIERSWRADGSATEISQQIDQLKQSTLILDQLTTDSASYLNEASRYELDFKKSFFGSHYNKLRSIKDKYDPTSLFIVHSGVGSEDWDAELVCGHRRG